MKLLATHALITAIIVIFEAINFSESFRTKRLVTKFSIPPSTKTMEETQFQEMRDEEKSADALHIQPVVSYEEELELTLSFVQDNISSTSITIPNLYLTFSENAKSAKGFIQLQNIINDPDLRIQTAFVEIHLNQSILCSESSDVDYDGDHYYEGNRVSRQEMNEPFRNRKMEKGTNNNSSRNGGGGKIITSHLINYTAWVRQKQLQENLLELDEDIICLNDSSPSACNDSNNPVVDGESKTAEDYVDRQVDHSTLSVNMTHSFISHEKSNRAVGLAHRCLKTEKTSLQNHETLLVIDVLPLVQLWIQSDDKCPRKKKELETFLFSLMMDGTLMSLDSDQDSIGILLEREPIIRLHYKIDSE